MFGFQDTLVYMAIAMTSTPGSWWSPSPLRRGPRKATSGSAWPSAEASRLLGHTLKADRKLTIDIAYIHASNKQHMCIHTYIP